ncbi:MAG: tetratricopeptide repeat protein, partial [Muribaculaceae bacterium]|nr:tetratricopeptide repeat protein [Muribaculaceae bacterium]
MNTPGHIPGLRRERARLRGLSALALRAAALLCVCLAIGGCSTRKNTAATRNYQAFITRYNIYYNGDKHFKETLAEMEDKYEDDYSRQLYLHPVEAKAEPTSPQPSGNFDRSIEKAQKAIQLRSIKKKPAKKSGKASDPAYKAWMKRDEYNPFLHNAWMMMGRSQYYNGDFAGAASTFFYISRHFGWLPATVTEAQLMQAMSYLGMGWLFEAEMILNRIKPDELTDNNLRLLYNTAMADYLLRKEQYAEALPYLREAASKSKGAQKTRLTFLLGQTLAREGHKAEAYEAFKKAGSSTSASYRTKFNARIKQSEVFEGKDIENEVAALNRMTRYDRNKDYLDQIYYAIGNLYLSRGDTAHAIENYELANSKSTRNGIDKAMNQLTLGRLYFEQGNYEKAQPSYSEAVPQLPESFPDYATLKRRSDVLDELAVYSQNVNLQDSLLHLASLPEDELLKVIDGMIADLVKREKEEADEARRLEYEANSEQFGNQLQDNTNSFTINSDNSWYFYNTATKNAGKTEFQKRWGSRKLEDNWRRRNKASFNTQDFDAPTDEGEQGESAGEESAAEETEEAQQSPEELARAADPHNPEYYLAQIPFKDEEKQTAHEVIQEGLYNMGVILKDKLEDFGASQHEFDRLLKDYPDNIYRLDTYYNLYLMFMRQGRTQEAEAYRKLIIEDFADSKYGMAMRDPEYLEKLKTMDARQQALYDKTYEAYLANDNEGVHRGYDEMMDTYPMSKIVPKFMFLNALAYVTDREPEKFNAQLRELLERYPDTDITPIASAWLKGMAQGRQLQTPSSGNLRGMVWDTRLTNDSIMASGDAGPLEFDLNPDTRQLLIFTFDTGDVSSNELLYEIARHNFRAFVVKDFDLEPMNFGRLGMILVKGFDNMAELNHYRRVMASAPDFRLPAGVRPIAISEANFQTLLDNGSSFDEYFKYLQEQNYIDTQADLLQPQAIETLEEADKATKEIKAEIKAEEASAVAPTEAAESAEGASEDDPEPAAAAAPQAAPADAPVAPATPATAPPAPAPTAPAKPAISPAA